MGYENVGPSSQISPLRVLFLQILKTFCPFKGPSKHDVVGLLYFLRAKVVSEGGTVTGGGDEEVQSSLFHRCTLSCSLGLCETPKAGRHNRLINSNSEGYLDQKSIELILGK
jgi:hypothetical protein